MECWFWTCRRPRPDDWCLGALVGLLPLGDLACHIGATLLYPEFVVVSRGAILEPSWGNLEPSWPSWGQLGAIRSHLEIILEPSWHHFGTILGSFGTIFGIILGHLLMVF